MPKISKFVKFGENTINEAQNTYTDQQMIDASPESFLGKLLKDGIAYGSVAESDILNAIFRQTTFSSTLLAEFIKTRYAGADITLDTSMNISDALTALENSLMSLVNTIRPVINNLNETVPGKTLDATQGGILAGMISNEANTARNAESAISNNVSNLANSTSASMNSMNNSVSNMNSALSNNISNLSANKLDKINKTNVAFVTNETNQPESIPYSQGIVANGFPMTSATGQVTMNEPTLNNHGATMGYVSNVINGSVKVLYEDFSTSAPSAVTPGITGKITITTINAANFANVVTANKVNRLFVVI